jgi:hypothetical protein
MPATLTSKSLNERYANSSVCVQSGGLPFRAQCSASSIFCSVKPHRNGELYDSISALSFSVRNVSLCLPPNTTPWPESASDLYRPSDRRLSAKLVPTFADRENHVVSLTDPYGRILGFLDRSR